MCRSGDDRKGNEILLCDGEGCPAARHMHCLTPPLSRVPRGNWFCPECAAKRQLARRAGRGRGRREESVADLSDYERQRLENMARNQAELVKLGLAD